MTTPKKETIIHAYREKGNDEEICIYVNNSIDIKQYDFDRFKDFVKKFLASQREITYLLTIACLENIHDLGMSREEFIQMINEMYDELNGPVDDSIVIPIPYKHSKIKN